MKKKGLIISTVVMVVVLIAALTTTTFAWFSTTAQASISDLQLQTASAAGLEIAHYNPTDAESVSTTFKHGQGTWSTNHWEGAEENWGSSISFDTTAANLTSYGVSGDGIHMVRVSDESAKIANNGKLTDDVTMKQATANSDYFVGYVALHDTKAKQDGDTNTVVVTDITINVEANAGGYTGIAASMRIAVFAIDTLPEEGAVKFTSENLKLVYIPYANYSYSTASGAWTEAADSNSYKTFSGDTYEGGRYDALATSGKFAENVIYGDYNASTGPANFTAADTTMNETAIGTTAYTGEKTVLYTMIVIWFEGEDPDCITQFAGGKATVNLNFGFKEA